MGQRRGQGKREKNPSFQEQKENCSLTCDVIASTCSLIPHAGYDRDASALGSSNFTAYLKSLASRTTYTLLVDKPVYNRDATYGWLIARSLPCH